MLSSDGGKEQFYVFEIDDTYLFKHYFQIQSVFSELQQYYNESEYRFEIPPDEFDDVRELLEENYYEPVVVDDLEEFCVVKEQYTEHADILKNSVENWSRRGYNFFLMKDLQAVEQAIEQGAKRVERTDLVLGI